MCSMIQRRWLETTTEVYCLSIEERSTVISASSNIWTVLLWGKVNKPGCNRAIGRVPLGHEMSGARLLRNARARDAVHKAGKARPRYQPRLRYGQAPHLATSAHSFLAFRRTQRFQATDDGRLYISLDGSSSAPLFKSVDLLNIILQAPHAQWQSVKISWPLR